MKYNVHVYAIARIKVPDIEAQDQKDAIRRVIETLNIDSLLSFNRAGIKIEYADDIVRYLVDIVGDSGYLHTKSYYPDELEESDDSIRQSA